MIKKVLIVGLFLGGGYLFIKKVLPQFVGKSNSLDVDTTSVDEAIAEEERKQREVAKKVQEQLKKKFGTTDPKALNRIQTYYGTGVDFDNLTPEQIESIRNTLKNNSMFPNGLTYDPNNLNSFQGLGNVDLTQMFG